MQKEIVEKLIDRICTDTENMYSCSPKVSPAKVIPNFILLFELISLNTKHEERINKILQSYYFYEYLKEIHVELGRKAYELIIGGRAVSYYDLDKECEKILKGMGMDADYWQKNTLRSYITRDRAFNGIKVTDEFKIKFCKYLGLDPAVYLPSKTSYHDYLIQRQNELMQPLNDSKDDAKLAIEPNLKYQGMISDMKEALFNKFSSFVEKINNEAWEGKIDGNKLCSETQELTTDLKEYRKAANG